MAIDTAETRAWAQANKVAWEISPLVEMHKGQRMQVGFELSLYARMPADTGPGEARAKAALALWERMREIAESMAPKEGAHGRADVEPFEAAGRLRRETEFAPEVLLKVRIVHAEDYFQNVDDDDRQRLKPVEARLTELGLRHRSW